MIHLAKSSRTVIVDRQRRQLTDMETVLCAIFTSREPGCIVSMDDILDEMYPNPDMEPPNSVAVMRTLIMRLRKKVTPYRIKNVRGRGYMLLTGT